MKDNTSKPMKASKEALLGELESIRELLDKYQEDDLPVDDIPLLDDVVDQQHLSSDQGDDDHKLLDLDSIFGDGDDLVLEQNENIKDELLADDDQLEDLDSLAELDIDINIPNFKLSATVQEDEPTNAEETPPQSPHQDQSHTQDNKQSPRSVINMDQLVQEVIDEFIPAIEAQLRRRLTEYAPKDLKQLTQKINNA